MNLGSFFLFEQHGTSKNMKHLKKNQKEKVSTESCLNHNKKKRLYSLQKHKRLK